MRASRHVHQAPATAKLEVMKVFNLRCVLDHTFEGWFDSPEDVDAQAGGGRIECPMCSSTKVLRAPTAARLNLPSERREAATMPTSAQLQAMFLKVAREIAANSEDVGEKFAEEARRIHYKEAPERAIRGVATSDEARELHEEGVPVMPLPFGDLLKRDLQ